MRDPVFLTVSSRSRLSIASPCNVWLYGHGEIFGIAAAYAFHLAQAQAFLAGNKRTGIGAALVFLEGNGIAVSEATDKLYLAMIALPERRMDKPELAALLRRLCG